MIDCKECRWYQTDKCTDICAMKDKEKPFSMQNSLLFEKGYHQAIDDIKKIITETRKQQFRVKDVEFILDYVTVKVNKLER